MRTTARHFALFGMISALPLGLASGQTVAPAQQAPLAPPPAAVQPQPAPVQAEPVPVAPPPLFWTIQDANEMLAFINSIGSEGLDPADYDPQGLIAALRSGDPVKVSAVATEKFNQVSSDLALGHVRGEARGQWLIEDKDIDSARQYLLLKAALEQHRVIDALKGLLPTHPQYGDLKTALAKTALTDAEQRDRLKLNLDRWRWLPRDLGQKYIIVNVPAFYVALVENGQTRWRERAVAGATKTPTPMLSATATGVILNPWWEVPKSIEPEVRGKAGYVPVKRKDGSIQRWRQPPGPSNALGQVKFVMPNPEAIYLHDTNARSRFNSQIRSLSHGCIRTNKILDLSAELLADDGGEWTRDKIDETLASKKSVQASFVKPLPVYIVYFSSAASTDGRIINYKDVYKLDGEVKEALNAVKGASGTRTASR